MKFHPSGYSSDQFKGNALRYKAKKIAEVLPKLMEVTGADAVVVTGKSGMSFAFATLMLIDFPLIVVRKDNESSHGNTVEGTPEVEIEKYLILDDFVASGATVSNIINAMDKWSHKTFNGDWNAPDEFDIDTYGPRCVGVLEYDRDAYYDNTSRSYQIADGRYEHLNSYSLYNEFEPPVPSIRDLKKSMAAKKDSLLSRFLA